MYRDSHIYALFLFTKVKARLCLWSVINLKSALIVSLYIPKLFSPKQLSILIWLLVVTKWAQTHQLRDYAKSPWEGTSLCSNAGYWPSIQYDYITSYKNSQGYIH